MLLINQFVMAASFASENNDLTIYQVMQRVLDRYPSLKISEIEVAQAAEQKQQIESSLGWILNSSAGVMHDLTALGTPSDRLDVTGSVGRKLESGASVSLNGGYRYEDSSLVFNKAFPNPAHTTRLDLSYRLPLLQGEGNPVYAQGIISSEAGHELAKANHLLTKITLAEKVKDLFYATAVTTKRIESAQKAVARAKKLNEYVISRYKLGLAEDKDKLQSKAQLQSKLAELSGIQLQWEQQKRNLNRLMIEKWDANLNPVLLNLNTTKDYDLVHLIRSITNYHPTVKMSQANLQIAESEIKSARDTTKDNLDLVVSVGSRTSSGKNTTGGTVNEQDWAGAVRVEYNHLFDDKGVSSKYNQAQLKRNIALVNIKKIEDDIRYTASGLVSEIKSAKQTVDAAYQTLKSESLKLKEAEYRYRNGRSDTAQLIQFQNEFSFAELSYLTQKVDLNNRIIALQIFSGQFWDKLHTHNGVK